MIANPSKNALSAMFESATVMLLALLVDALFGDPLRVYRHLPHPVALIGHLVSYFERRLNIDSFKASEKIFVGAVAALTIIIIAAAVGTFLHILCTALPFGALLEVLLASTLIASRSLYEHVHQVATGLQQDLQHAREAVSHIVGRDPSSLDEAGVARAAIESSAENFSDGVVAPIFWGVLFGLPGIAMYKAINTLDSMLGHKNERYLHFGRAAAQIDDYANWIPARIAGAIICCAAALTPKANMHQAWQTMHRDAHLHRSPNAGWQEAAFAGALDIALAGPRVYANETVDDPWMGDGRKNLTAEDVHRALRLYLTANAVLAALLLLVVLS